MIGAKVANMRSGARTDLEPSLNSDEVSAEDAASRLQVSRDSVFKAKKVLTKGVPELAQAVETGQVSISLAAVAADSNTAEQKEFLRKVQDGTTPAKAWRSVQRERQREENQKRVKNYIALETSNLKYSTIIIDPPWPVQKILRDDRPAQDIMDYPTMEVEKIARLPIADLANPDGCQVYLWTTHKFLPDALHLFELWGVKYECLLTWIKNVGFTPFSWMYSTEHVLFGRIGSPELQELGIRLDFRGDVRQHSRKPDEFYEIVKRVSLEPRLELFSREARNGFSQWGNEVNVFQG